MSGGRVIADDVILSSHPVGPFSMNMYLVGCKKTRKAALVDCGAEDASELEFFSDVVATHGLEVTHLLQTHAHIDHVAGLPAARAVWPDATIYLHEHELPLYRGVEQQAANFGVPYGAGRLPENNLVHCSDGDVIHVGSTVKLKVVFTPGHSPGHVCFHDTTNTLLFGGDLIFAGSVGRTDLPLCDRTAMKESLRRVVRELPPATVILPGHMHATDLAHEAATNPFMKGL